MRIMAAGHNRNKIKKRKARKEQEPCAARPPARLPPGGEKAGEDGGVTSRDTEQPEPSGDSQQERPAVSL